MLTRDERQVDLLVVGSRLEAPRGQVLLSALAQNEIEDARCPVLVVPRGVTIDFPAVLAHAA
jgi:nucleotide-binding universal stress UspA family protein